MPPTCRSRPVLRVERTCSPLVIGPREKLRSDRTVRSQRPRLLVVIGTLGHMGGAERQALYLLEYLSQLQACDVEVLTFHDGAALRPHLDRLGFSPHVFPYYFRWPRAKRARSMARLAWILRTEIKPDALLPFVGIHSKAVAQAWPYTGARFCW